MNQNTLNPAHYINAISRQPDYVEARLSLLAENLTQDEIIAERRKAIGRGAISAFENSREQLGEFDLETRLMGLVSHLPDFLGLKTELDEYQARYHGLANSEIPKYERIVFKENKRRMISFNHSLKEVIELGHQKISFNELLNFMTDMHIAINGHATAEQFHNLARQNLYGMRNEVAVEKILLRYSDFESIEMGDEDDDWRGKDIIIDGTPIDVKAGHQNASWLKQKAQVKGYNPDLIVWSHIRAGDYAGKLELPDEACEKIAPALIADIEKAIESHRATTRPA